MTKSFKIIFCAAVFLFLSNAISICASERKGIVSDQYEAETLNEIGRATDIESSRLIICDDIDESGFGSVYIPHVFRSNDVSGISNYNWSFVLYDNTGKEHIISTGSGSQFEIQPLQDIGNYKTDSNGNIIGSIICGYSLNGKQESSTFTVFLEQKPVILSIEKKEIHSADNYEGFYLTFDVYYLGADTIYIDLEEEYSSSLRSQIIRSPYKASVRTGNINPYNYAWVYVRVYNKYGEAVETIELEPETADAETFDYEISNIKYDYTVSLKNGEYDISGDFSFDVKVSNIPEFIIANTNPDGHIKDFYSAQRVFEADPEGVTEKKYMRPYTRPETFFKLLIRKKDGSFFSSPAICSTDYLREEDKALLSSGIPSEYVSEGITIDIGNSTLRLSSGFDMQQVSLIDISGNVIKHIDLCSSQKCEISLADISGGFYIVCITDTKGGNYNRKIIF